MYFKVVVVVVLSYIPFSTNSTLTYLEIPCFLSSFSRIFLHCCDWSCNFAGQLRTICRHKQCAMIDGPGLHFWTELIVSFWRCITILAATSAKQLSTKSSITLSCHASSLYCFLIKVLSLSTSGMLSSVNYRERVKSLISCLRIRYLQFLVSLQYIP